MYKVTKTENGKFSVKKDGAKRASKVFDNEKEANEYASTMNSKENSNQVDDKVNDKANDNVKSEKSQTVTTNKSKTNKKSSKTSTKKGLKKIWAWLLGILGIGAVGATATVAVVNNTGGGNDGITLSEGIVYDDFQIHFMTLGNDKAGDSVYIKAGDTDILIDAGSRSGSSKTTIPYMQKYVKDNKLEYVIATHGDQDHVEAFPSILKTFSADTIILNKQTTKTSSAYANMIDAFDEQVSKGAKQYYADQCIDQKNGAKSIYQLSDKVTMEILWNYYYWNSSTDENNYSVCTLFTYKNLGETKTFMLTGDLEKEGEEKMAEHYNGSTPELTLPKVDMFKAGHHGSKTSSNDCLLDIIQPKMCVVSCCCGTDEYTGITANQFPTQQFIDRIAKWTDAVYVTTIYDSYEIVTAKAKENGKTDKTGVEIGSQYVHTTGFKDMNGNICVSVGVKTDEATSTKSVEIGLACSNNTIKLKDSEWMNLEVTIDGVKTHFRTMPEQWKKSEVKTNDTN